MFPKSSDAGSNSTTCRPHEQISKGFAPHNSIMDMPMTTAKVFDQKQEYWLKKQSCNATESEATTTDGKWSPTFTNGCQKISSRIARPVSYTHLTLPTIYSV